MPKPTSTISAAAAPDKRETASWAEIVARKVESLRYGVVQIIVYDGQVVQIERTERVRIAPAPTGKAASRYQE